MLSGLAGLILKEILSALVSMVLGYLKDRMSERTNQELGEERVKKDVSREAADAEVRASKAMVNSPDVDHTIADMERGTF